MAHLIKTLIAGSVFAAMAVRMKASIEKSCQAQMVANAVKATERQDLLVYHEQETTTHPATFPVQLAAAH